MEPPASEPPRDLSPLKVISLRGIYLGTTPTVGEVRNPMGMDEEKSPNPVGRTARFIVANDASRSRLPEIRARPRHLPLTRNQIPNQSHSRLRRRCSAPNKNVFLFGSRRTNASEVCATTEPISSSIQTRPWTTGSLLPPIRGCITSSSSWESISSAG